MREEQISINLRVLNKRYIELYNKTRNGGFFMHLKVFFKYLVYGRFEELARLIRKRLNKTDLLSKEEPCYDNYPHDIKAAIYTCIIGKYDSVKEPLYINKDCRYYLITDQEKTVSSNWIIINIRDLNIPQNLSSAEINRYIKLHPHILFPEYDISIYVDGSFQIVCDLFPLIGLMNDSQWLATHNLASGVDCVYESAKAIVYSGKAPADIIRRQLIFYKKEGYPKHNGMYENGVLIRKHNNPRCVKVMNDWWSQLMIFSKRDQMSLNYVLWKNSISNSEVLVFPETIYNNPFFIYNNHNQQTIDLSNH